MAFKSAKQRMAVMARLRSLKLIKLNNNQLIRRGIHLNPSKDFDGDGVRNKNDCKPLNKKEQGLIHDVISGVGRFGGFVVGETTSGVRDVPLEFKRQKLLTEEKQRVKQEELVKSREVQVARFREGLISERQRELKELEDISANRVKFKKVTLNDGKIFFTSDLRKFRRDVVIGKRKIKLIQDI